MYCNKIFTQKYKYDRMGQNKTIKAAYDRCTRQCCFFLRNEVKLMGIKINGCSVSPRELDILHILWAAGTPLLASEIMESNDELRLATVHTTLTRMLKKT